MVRLANSHRCESPWSTAQFKKYSFKSGNMCEPRKKQKKQVFLETGTMKVKKLFLSQKKWFDKEIRLLASQAEVCTCSTHSSICSFFEGRARMKRVAHLASISSTSKETAREPEGRLNGVVFHERQRRLAWLQFFVANMWIFYKSGLSPGRLTECRVSALVYECWKHFFHKRTMGKQTRMNAHVKLRKGDRFSN